MVGQVVQLEQDEELGPMRGMYGTLDAEFQLQRSITRAVDSRPLSTQKDCWSHHTSCG